jgi:heat shock protein beta
VQEDEYKDFYKSISKEETEPMTHIHFTAEGEVTFKSILFVPKLLPYDMFNNYGKRVEAIKLYVRRVFITDNFEDMMPKYLSFVRGVVSICIFYSAFSHRVCPFCCIFYPTFSHCFCPF